MSRNKNVKNGFYWLYEHGKSYNVFVADTDDYDDEEEDANVVAKYQRYSTRLYVILLFGKLLRKKKN